MRFLKTFSTLTFITIGMLTLGILSFVPSRQWILIQVEENSPHRINMIVPVPTDALRAIFCFFPQIHFNKGYLGKLPFGKMGIKPIIEQIEKCPDAFLVRVTSHKERLALNKKEGFLLFYYNNSETCEKVSVKIPITALKNAAESILDDGLSLRDFASIFTDHRYYTMLEIHSNIANIKIVCL